MFENPGRFITLTVALIVGALASMYIPDQPFRLGLDLRGGTRLVYRFDFDRAVAEGKITEAEAGDRAKLLRDTASIIRSRLDSYTRGLLEPSIRPEGEERLVIELPGETLRRAEASGALTEELSGGGLSLALNAPEELVNSFPATGGVIGIEGEKIRYGRRDGNVLADLTRGRDGTAAVAHAAGANVELLSDDVIRILIENTGDMRFFIGARSADFPPGTDQSTEQGKLDSWRQANPGVPVTEFNRVVPDQGGPMENLRWFPMRTPTGETPPPPELTQYQPLIVQPEQWRFSGDDLEAVQMSQDGLGYPAVFFELKPAKRAAFGEFTGQHINDGMAIVLNDEIVTLATINERLPGEGIISGGRKGFTRDEVNDLITVLRSGSLRIKPRLEQEERVGATLGDDYVKKGVYSSLLGLLAVLVFMAIYYRRLGIIAGASLLLNLLLLMGALAFLRATLTLPGIAGLILTVGMAVDSNILIYERIREESARGLKLAQAAKNGFDRAFVTIFDMNVTTLLSAIILYNFGTGPIKGFATTLIIGILTTLYSVLIGTKLLVHFALKGDAKEFGMTRIVAQTKIGFMALTRVALPVSVIAVVVGTGLFVALPDQQKLGIDFLGGFTLTARTQDPQPVDTMRSLVQGIDGPIGESADVKAVLKSGSEAEGYRQFRITYKLTGDEGADSSDAQETGEREIRDALAPVLQEDEIQVEVADAEGATTVSGSLFFEDVHPENEIANVLGGMGLADVQVQTSGQTGMYTFTATPTGAPPTSQQLEVVVQNGFQRAASDSTGTQFTFAEPIPESMTVGAQVSGELRDRAVQAVLLSLFVAVLYIRVRFKEYSYGFAVVVALVHDVLITLGALAVANWSGLIEAEINLAMVAAFLTIIGWSQNDTIVIFDRVRENLPRVKGSLKDILDLSINQTLSRTLLTSLTTLLAILILFVFNFGTRNVLEGFTFAMLVGVLSGTYSTVFIACPTLLWIENRSARVPSPKSDDKAEKAA